MTLRVLLDLSPLEHAATDRGVRRYVEQLVRALSRAAPDRELMLGAVLDMPWVGAPQITSDIAACLERIDLARERGLFGTLTRARPGTVSRGAKRMGAHLIHSIAPEGSPKAALALPRVVTCHHLESNAPATEWHGTKSRVQLDPRHFLRAEKVIAMSRATAGELIAHLDIPRGKIEVVHSAIDPRLWSPQRNPEDPSRLAAMGLTAGAYFLCVGALLPRKNFENTLRALRLCHDMSGHASPHLVWVGDLDRWQREDLAACARKAGVGAAVRILGRVSDAELGALYRHAVALSFVSRREGFGFPLLEAMASGCPVITSTCSSMIEIAGDAALSVDPEDVQALADAMLLLVSDALEQDRLRRAGLLRASAFSESQMAEGTLRIYRHAAAQMARWG